MKHFEICWEYKHMSPEYSLLRILVLCQAEENNKIQFENKKTKIPY